MKFCRWAIPKIDSCTFRYTFLWLMIFLVMILVIFLIILFERIPYTRMWRNHRKNKLMVKVCFFSSEEPFTTKNRLKGNFLFVHIFIHFFVTWEYIRKFNTILKIDIRYRKCRVKYNRCARRCQNCYHTVLINNLQNINYLGGSLV